MQKTKFATIKGVTIYHVFKDGLAMCYHYSTVAPNQDGHWDCIFDARDFIGDPDSYDLGWLEGYHKKLKRWLRTTGIPDGQIKVPAKSN